MQNQYPAMRTGKGDMQTFTVAAGQSVRFGMGVKVAATDTAPAEAEFPQAQEAIADTDDIKAIAWGNPGDVFAAGEQFDGYLLTSGSTVLHVLVGTGGATRGSRAVAVSDGFTNAAVNGNATTRIFSPGWFDNAGTAGAIVALNIDPQILNKT